MVTKDWTKLQGLRFQFQKHCDHDLYPAAHHLMNGMYSVELSDDEFDSLFETTARTAVKRDVLTLLKDLIKAKIDASATKTEPSHLATIVPRVIAEIPITFTGTNSTHRNKLRTVDNFKRLLNQACDTKG